MTKSSKWHWPEQIVQEIQDADLIFAEGDTVAALLKELIQSHAKYHPWRKH